MLKKIILNNILPLVLGVLVFAFWGGIALASDTRVDAVKLPRDMQAGFNYGAYVRLSAPAPAGGVVVALVTNVPYDIRMPGYLLIKEGQKTGRFPIHVSDISKGQIALIAVSDGETSVTARARVHAAQSQSRTVFQRQAPIRWRVPDDWED